MTEEIEPGHEDNAVNTKLPLLLKHSFGLAPEVTSANVFVA